MAVQQNLHFANSGSKKFPIWQSRLYILQYELHLKIKISDQVPKSHLKCASLHTTNEHETPKPKAMVLRLTLAIHLRSDGYVINTAAVYKTWLHIGTCVHCEQMFGLNI